MAKKENPLLLDLSLEIKKVNNLTLKQIDEFFSELTNKIYDTYDYICELDETPIYIKTLSSKEIEVLKGNLQRINKQSIELNDMLCDIDYENKNIDRTQHMLNELEEYTLEQMELIK